MIKLGRLSPPRSKLCRFKIRSDPSGFGLFFLSAQSRFVVLPFSFQLLIFLVPFVLFSRFVVLPFPFLLLIFLVPFVLFSRFVVLPFSFHPSTISKPFVFVCRFSLLLFPFCWTLVVILLLLVFHKVHSRYGGCLAFGPIACIQEFAKWLLWVLGSMPQSHCFSRQRYSRKMRCRL